VSPTPSCLCAVLYASVHFVSHLPCASSGMFHISGVVYPTAATYPSRHSLSAPSPEPTSTEVMESECPLVSQGSGLIYVIYGGTGRGGGAVSDVNFTTHALTSVLALAVITRE
jgi:hypothetical protein